MPRGCDVGWFNDGYVNPGEKAGVSVHKNVSILIMPYERCGRFGYGYGEFKKSDLCDKDEDTEFVDGRCISTRDITVDNDIAYQQGVNSMAAKLEAEFERGVASVDLDAEFQKGVDSVDLTAEFQRGVDSVDPSIFCGVGTELRGRQCVTKTFYDFKRNGVPSKEQL